MLSKTILLALVGTVSAQSFLGSPALYPTSMVPKSLGESQTPAKGQHDMFNFNDTKVGNIQFQCQYMAGLNFYDLQPLSIAQSKEGGYS